MSKLLEAAKAACKLFQPGDLLSDFDVDKNAEIAALRAAIDAEEARLSKPPERGKPLPYPESYPEDRASPPTAPAPQEPYGYAAEENCCFVKFFLDEKAAEDFEDDRNIGGAQWQTLVPLYRAPTAEADAEEMRLLTVLELHVRAHIKHGKENDWLDTANDAQERFERENDALCSRVDAALAALDAHRAGKAKA